MNFSKVKLKKTFVKVPKLKARKDRIKKISQKKDDKILISSIVDIMIKSAVDRAKTEKKAKAQVEEDKSYTSLRDDKTIESSGYGAMQKAYGTAPHASYVDYEKLFSYLGKFRAKQPYENMAEHTGMLNKATESSSFVLADREAIDKIGRFDKYMKSPVMDMPVMALSLVPIAGLSSAEWEEIKMMMKLDPAMYNLKTKTG